MHNIFFPVCCWYRFLLCYDMGYVGCFYYVSNGLVYVHLFLFLLSVFIFIFSREWFLFHLNYGVGVFKWLSTLGLLVHAHSYLSGVAMHWQFNSALNKLESTYISIKTLPTYTHFINLTIENHPSCLSAKHQIHGNMNPVEQASSLSTQPTPFI
jgi:hypothetical protein